MINPRISADLSTTKPISSFSCTQRVKEVHTKAEVLHLTPGVHGLEYYSIVTHRKCIAKHMINPRIYSIWTTTKQIAPFSCTSCVLEVHTNDEFVQLIPGLLGLGIIRDCGSNLYVGMRVVEMF